MFARPYAPSQLKVRVVGVAGLAVCPYATDAASATSAMAAALTIFISRSVSLGRPKGIGRAADPSTGIGRMTGDVRRQVAVCGRFRAPGQGGMTDIGTAIVGGAMLPHAPQFFTLPETEDKENVAQVQAVARRIGDELRALRPDVWISVSNDHAFQFFQKVAPPFTFHVGGEARGEFAGRKFSYRIASDLSFQVVRELYRMGFDPAFTSTAEVDYALGIPLTHMGAGLDRDARILPVFVNAYLPPQ